MFSVPLHSRWSARKKRVFAGAHAQKIAYVRKGNQLHPGEVEYLKNRQPKIKAALEEITGENLDDINLPTISVVCSGGGCRAMLGTIGSLSGLEQIGVFDAVTYICTLSGSTWALNVLMATRMTIAQLKRYVKQILVRDFYEMRKSDKKLITRMFFEKLSSSQSLTTVDLFGAFLAKHFFKDHFGNDCQRVHLSDQAEYVTQAHVPFPIYTAIDGRMRAVAHPAWYEFNPFEIGSARYAMYVPAWALGRRFDQGKSINFAPEQSLGFLLGVFGSAFCAHIGLAWDRVLKDLAPSFMKNAIETFLIKSKVGQLRFSWARVRNFMFGMDGTDLEKTKNLKLIDGGIECNLPYAPVSGEREERLPDILIFFDFSQSRIPDSLRKVEAYARQHNLKFPAIDYTDIEKQTISIFKDESDTTVPVVIYMPRVTDHLLWQEKKRQGKYKKYALLEDFDFGRCAASGECKTLNFTYSTRASRQVMDQMEFNVVANEEMIIDVIKWVMKRKASVV